MYCTKCGAKQDGAHKFCANCGTQFASYINLSPEPQSRWDTASVRAPAQQDAPGRRFLFVPGILYIVFGAIMALYLIGVLATTDEWLWEFGGEAMRGAWNLYYIANLFHVLFWIFIGIMGIVHRRNRNRAGLMLGLGAADLTMMILLYIAAAPLGIYDFHGAEELAFIPVYCVLPVLTIIGAVKNRVREGMTYG